MSHLPQLELARSAIRLRSASQGMRNARISKESALERLVSNPRHFHQLGKPRLVAKTVEKWILNKVRIGKKSVFDAEFENSQSRLFVTQDGVRLGNLVSC